MKLSFTLTTTALTVALICFLIGALASIFGWNLGRFNAIAWGLFFLALSLWH